MTNRSAIDISSFFVCAMGSKYTGLQDRRTMGAVVLRPGILPLLPDSMMFPPFKVIVALILPIIFNKVNPGKACRRKRNRRLNDRKKCCHLERATRVERSRHRFDFKCDPNAQIPRLRFTPLGMRKAVRDAEKLQCAGFGPILSVISPVQKHGEGQDLVILTEKAVRILDILTLS